MTGRAPHAWHHHTYGQTLFVIKGEGYMQARGSDVVRIRPDDAVRPAPGEEHWHGATANNFMTSLALTEGDTVWGDQLTGAEYPAG